MKKCIYLSLIAVVYLATHFRTSAANLQDTILVNVNNGPSPGYLLLAPMPGNTLCVYDNTGYPVVLKELPDTKTSEILVNYQVHPNGLFTYFDFQEAMFYGLDDKFNVVDSFFCIGQATDFHDMKFMSNGNALLIAEYYRTMDLSGLVPDGKTNARVRFFIIQEIDKNKNLVWEWDSYNHFDVLDATPDIDLSDNTVNLVHMNSVFPDSDGNILVSSRHLDEITKINRSTGQVMWRMGGKYCKNNQFRFLNDTINGFWGFSHQHDIQRLPNGNILLLDNGNLREEPFSRVVEYRLDETNKTATKIWEYRKNPDVFVPWMGNAQRLSNGNTVIGWGAYRSVEHEGNVDTSLAVTEVKPDGTIVYEMSLVNVMSYRVFRQIIKMDAVTKNVASTGNFDFVNQKYNTNISLNITEINGSGDLSIEKHYYAPPEASYIGGTPCVTFPYRWVISSSDINSVEGIINIKLVNLKDIDLLGDLKLYYRQAEGQGAFKKLTTSYNSQSKVLSANFEGKGEFIIGSELLNPPSVPKPPDFSLGINISAKLEWNNVYGTYKYNVQLSKDSNFANLLYDLSVFDDTTMIYYELDFNETYYWRVKSFSANCTSQWSNVWRFETTMRAPILTLPEDKGNNIYPNGSLRWNSVIGANDYILQIALDSTFEELVFDNINVPSNFYNLSGLNYNTEYFWRVRAKNQYAQSAWSVIWSFRTILATPESVSPIEGVVGMPISGVIEWNPVDGAELYLIQIADNEEFFNPIISYGGLTENRFDYDDLENEKTYYWRVRAINYYGRGDYSDTEHFKTIHSAPLLAKPINSAINIPTSGVLTWKDRPIIKAYRVQISSDSDFVNIIIDNDDIHSGIYEYSGLEENTTYYWRVNATNDEGTSVWSEFWEFTTRGGEMLDLPVLMSPSDSQHGVSLTGYLTWQPVPFAKKYRVQLAKDSDFENLILDIKEVAIVSAYYSGLEYYTDYYWRVYARNDLGSSDWSEPAYFKTKIDAPIQISPTLNEVEAPLSGQLKWQGKLGSERFSLQLSDNPDFVFNIIDVDNISSDSFDYTDLEYNTSYYWRVRGNDDYSSSDWSDIWSFTTLIQVSVDDDYENYKPSISIYPNPVNEISVLSLYIPKETNAQIEILNTLGESIQVIHNGILSQGFVSFNLNTESLSGGVYHAIIRTGKHINVCNFVLMK